LAAKGFLVESKIGRLNVFRARAPREDYITSLIMEALSSTSDRQAVLTRFAQELPTSDVAFFRKIFSRRPR
jgi:predicted transcriptional regulator